MYPNRPPGQPGRPKYTFRHGPPPEEEEQWNPQQRQPEPAYGDVPQGYMYPVAPSTPAPPSLAPTASGLYPVASHESVEVNRRAEQQLEALTRRNDMVEQQIMRRRSLRAVLDSVQGQSPSVAPHTRSYPTAPHLAPSSAPPSPAYPMGPPTGVYGMAPPPGAYGMATPSQRPMAPPPPPGAKRSFTEAEWGNDADSVVRRTREQFGEDQRWILDLGIRLGLEVALERSLKAKVAEATRKD